MKSIFAQFGGKSQVYLPKPLLRKKNNFLYNFFCVIETEQKRKRASTSAAKDIWLWKVPRGLLRFTPISSRSITSRVQTNTTECENINCCFYEESMMPYEKSYFLSKQFNGIFLFFIQYKYFSVWDEFLMTEKLSEKIINNLGTFKFNWTIF